MSTTASMSVQIISYCTTTAAEAISSFPEMKTLSDSGKEAMQPKDPRQQCKPITDGTSMTVKNCLAGIAQTAAAV
jgi:hypothetical protein